MKKLLLNYNEPDGVNDGDGEPELDENGNPINPPADGLG